MMTESATEALTAAARPGLGRAAAQILLVEDSPTQAMHTRLILEAAGWGVEVCGHGGEVVDAAARAAPDLILLDMHLPGLDGIEVASRLKADPDLADIPVVFLTGVFRDVRHIIGGLEHGADDYVLKTVSDDELVARVRACLRVRGLQRNLGRLARLLLAVNRIGSRLAGLVDLDALLDAACRLLHRELGYPSVAISLAGEPDADAEGLVVTASAGAPAAARLIGGLVRDDDGPATGSEMAVPLRPGGEPCGILLVSSPDPGAFDESDELALGTIGDLLGAAIHGARLYRRMEEQANRDALSGLLGRRAILGRLDAEWARSWRHGRPLAVISLDIDRFKRVNDEHGHAAGDAAIRAVAGAIERAIRCEDIAGRIGGDEFLIVLPETDGAGALEVAERVRAAAEELEVPCSLADGQPVRLALSLGAASWPETPVADPTALLHASDQALYQAKAAGRNQARLAP